jgi:hypothetical protein
MIGTLIEITVFVGVGVGLCAWKPAIATSIRDKAVRAYKALSS